MAASTRSSLILSRRDLDFLLHEWLDVTSLTSRPRFAEHSRETFDAVLDLGEEIATEHFAPHNALADAHEPMMHPDGTVEIIPEVRAALDVFAKAGLLAGQLDEELGGLALPSVVGKAVLTWFQAANVGTSAYPFLTMANANLLVAHGTPEQVDTWVRPMTRRSWTAYSAGSSPTARVRVAATVSVSNANPAPPRIVILRPSRSSPWMPWVPSWIGLSRLSR